MIIVIEFSPSAEQSMTVPMVDAQSSMGTTHRSYKALYSWWSKPILHNLYDIVLAKANHKESVNSRAGKKMNTISWYQLLQSYIENYVKVCEYREEWRIIANLPITTKVSEKNRLTPVFNIVAIVTKCPNLWLLLSLSHHLHSFSYQQSW